MKETAQRVAMTAAVRRLETAGLNRGSTGNLSCRLGGGLLISPTAIPAQEINPGDFVWLGFNGEKRGRRAPSTEWRFHAALYRARPELHAIVHTHSVHATALACLGRGIPPFHYMVALAGGAVRCAPYKLFGTEALSQAVVRAMAGRYACLLAHHGLVAAAGNLAQAIKIAREMEALAEMYLKASAVKTPRQMSPKAMAAAQKKFRTYGQG